MWPEFLVYTLVVLAALNIEGASPDPGDLNITRDDVYQVYTAPIVIGGQPFTVLIDTSSTGLWVPSFICSSDACAARLLFDPTQSKTFVGDPQDKPFNISYSSISYAAGTIGTDTIDLAGITIPSINFGMITDLSDDFTDYPWDGILGLAPRDDPFGMTGILTILDGIKTMGFSTLIYNARNVLMFSTNKGNFPPPLNGWLFAPAIVGNNNQAEWAVTASSVSLLTNNNSFPLSTGNINISLNSTQTGYAVPQNVASIILNVPGSQKGPDPNTYYIPCDADIYVTMQFSTGTYKLMLHQGVTINDQNMCLSPFQGVEGVDSQWIFGAEFLMSNNLNFYTVTNPPTVGFPLY